MAKYCVECGKKIGLFENKHTLEDGKTKCHNCYFKENENKDIKSEYLPIDEYLATRGLRHSKPRGDIKSRKQNLKMVNNTYTPPKKNDTDYKKLSDKEVAKKKFNAYLNPGVDEAEFERSSIKGKRLEQDEKSVYQKGKDKVKRIVDEDKK